MLEIQQLESWLWDEERAASDRALKGVLSRLGLFLAADP